MWAAGFYFSGRGLAWRGLVRPGLVWPGKAGRGREAIVKVQDVARLGQAGQSAARQDLAWLG